MLERADLQISRIQPEARLVLHCAPEDRAAFHDPQLPEAMLRAQATGPWHALHLAPDEWLLAGPRSQVQERVEHIGASGVIHSLVDVSDRTLAVDIGGSSATTLLNAGCPLDLGDDAFPPSACSRTLFGKASVLLWRPDAALFRLEYGRSFDGYISALLETAAHGLPELANKNR